MKNRKLKGKLILTSFLTLAMACSSPSGVEVETSEDNATDFFRLVQYDFDGATEEHPVFQLQEIQPRNTRTAQTEFVYTNDTTFAQLRRITINDGNIHRFTGKVKIGPLSMLDVLDNSIVIFEDEFDGPTVRIDRSAVLYVNKVVGPSYTVFLNGAGGIVAINSTSAGGLVVNGGQGYGPLNGLSKPIADFEIEHPDLYKLIVGGPLPILLRWQSATQINDKIFIEFETEYEYNSERVDIMRLYGEEWRVVGSIPSNNEPSYYIFEL